MNTTAVVDRARALRIARRPDEAARVLGEALAQSPDNGDLVCELAITRREQKQLPQALALAQQGAGLMPDSDWPHRIAATVLLDMKQPAIALQAAEVAIGMRPADVFGHMIAARAARAMRWYDRARFELGVVLQRDPTSIEAQHVLALVDLDQGRLVEARAVLLAALEQSPDNPGLLHTLGYTANRMGDKAEAGTYFLAAQRMDPTGEASKAALETVLGRPEPGYGAWVFLSLGVVGGMLVAPVIWEVRAATGVALLALTVLLWLQRRYRDRKDASHAEARDVARSLGGMHKARWGLGKVLLIEAAFIVIPVGLATPSGNGPMVARNVGAWVALFNLYFGTRLLLTRAKYRATNRKAREAGQRPRPLPTHPPAGPPVLPAGAPPGLFAPDARHASRPAPNPAVWPAGQPAAGGWGAAAASPSTYVPLMSSYRSVPGNRYRRSRSSGGGPLWRVLGIVAGMAVALSLGRGCSSTPAGQPTPPTATYPPIILTPGPPVTAGTLPPRQP